MDYLRQPLLHNSHDDVLQLLCFDFFFSIYCITVLLCWHCIQRDAELSRPLAGDIVYGQHCIKKKNRSSRGYCNFRTILSLLDLQEVAHLLAVWFDGLRLAVVILPVAIFDELIEVHSRGQSYAARQ